LAKSTPPARIESNSGVGLPVGFGEAPNLAVGDSLYQTTPYALFVSTKGKSFASLAARCPGLDDGDPVLVRGPKDKPVKLNPFVFYLVNLFQHFSEVDNQGVIQRTVLAAEEAAGDKALKEHLEAVLIVEERELGLVPCRCTFKTTKTNAARSAYDALKQATATQDQADELGLVFWGDLSPEHRATLPVPQPWARFKNTVTFRRGTGMASGYPYVAANSFHTPTGVADWKALAAFFADEGSAALCAAVHNAHLDRVALLKQKAK